jgi:hypothetical protein
MTNNKAVKETTGTKYHAGVFENRYSSDGSRYQVPVATKCNYSTISNSGQRRSFYSVGSYINCKRCLAAIKKEQRES